MDSVTGSGLKKGGESKRRGKVSVRQFMTAGFMLLVIATVVLPASMAGAQSQYLEGVDLLYRNYSMVTTYVEDRLAGDFLDAMMRLDAGELERHTVAGAYAPEAAGSPKGEANGLYVAYHFGGAEMDTLSTGYDADINGFSVGFERWRGNTLYALNLSSTKAEGDFTGDGLDIGSEDQKMLSLGLHAMGTYHDNWTWRGRVAGFKNEHDYEGLTGDTLGYSETAEYESTGVNASAMAGYLVRLGETWGMLLPEIGGEYLYTQRESFATETDLSAWDISMDRFYDNQVNGVASLRWTMRARLLNIDVVPSLAVGARMLLTGDQIHETRTIGDITTGISKDMDTFTTTVSASVLMHVTGHLQAEFTYDGGFGDDADQNLASLRIRFPF